MHTDKVKFEFFDHTADIGLRAYGRDLKEVFENTALGMFNILCEVDKVKLSTQHQFNVSADTIEELLVRYLSELLYVFSVKLLLLGKFEIHRMTLTEIESSAYGEFYDPQRHLLKKEIKTVTYHTLKVAKQNDHWLVQVIFDV